LSVKRQCDKTLKGGQAQRIHRRPPDLIVMGAVSKGITDDSDVNTGGRGNVIYAGRPLLRSVSLVNPIA